MFRLTDGRPQRRLTCPRRQRKDDLDHVVDGFLLAGFPPAEPAIDPQTVDIDETPLPRLALVPVSDLNDDAVVIPTAMPLELRTANGSIEPAACNASRRSISALI